MRVCLFFLAPAVEWQKNRCQNGSILVLAQIWSWPKYIQPPSSLVPRCPDQTQTPETGHQNSTAVSNSKRLHTHTTTKTLFTRTTAMPLFKMRSLPPTIMVLMGNWKKICLSLSTRNNMNAEHFDDHTIALFLRSNNIHLVSSTTTTSQSSTNAVKPLESHLVFSLLHHAVDFMILSFFSRKKQKSSTNATNFTSLSRFFRHARVNW